ncbi:MAG: DNA-directed RNA polymerase subunit alpha [bacterium]
MENLLLPSKVEFQAGSEAHTGTVVVSPCYYGYGTTLGNALRRVLLSSLPGGAAEAFKIKGTQHEFSTVEGVKEDIVEISLNLKQLFVKVFSDDPVTLNLTKKGPCEVKAGDIEPNSNVEVINKDLVIATLTSDKTLEMEIVVGKGRGFKPAEEKERKNYDLGTIVIDSVYTPVRDVGYHVENTRVGDITDFEKLTMNLETNGTIAPYDALKFATQILMDHFNIISQAAEVGGEEKDVESEIVGEEVANEEIVSEEVPAEEVVGAEEETPEVVADPAPSEVVEEDPKPAKKSRKKSK